MRESSHSLTLLQESMQHLEDPALRDDVLIMLQSKHPCPVLAGRAHTVGCAEIWSGERDGHPIDSVDLSFQDIWGKGCPACPNVLTSLLGYDQGSIVEGAMKLQAILGWKGQGHLILTHQYLLQYLTAVERRDPDTYNSDRVAEAGRIQSNLAGDVIDDPRTHIRDYVALCAAMDRLLARCDTNISYTQQQLRSAGVAWSESKAQLHSAPQEHFESLAWDRPQVWETFPDLCTELEGYYHEVLQEKEPVQVLVSVGTHALENATDMFEQAVQSIAPARGKHHFLTSDRAVADHLHRWMGAYRLGDLRADDTPGVVEIAQVLFQDAAAGSPFLEDGAALPGARLLNT